MIPFKGRLSRGLLDYKILSRHQRKTRVRKSFVETELLQKLSKLFEFSCAVVTLLCTLSGCSSSRKGSVPSVQFSFKNDCLQQLMGTTALDEVFRSSLHQLESNQSRGDLEPQQLSYVDKRRSNWFREGAGFVM
ncbi:hypothetical protein TNCT_64101 [Trichonephila clavata]|uniref:Uncharacterized protein n=1 Tax=Trichonephila clavata TaxID=2740835 RepID=A0A8X6LLS7_TRICU|nr:hypothetical protein TNCT_64101 [Trichonephila clavata]